MESSILDFVMAFIHHFSIVEPALDYSFYSKFIEMVFEVIKIATVGKNDLINDACNAVNNILKSARPCDLNSLFSRIDALDVIHRILHNEDNLSIKH